MRIKSAFWTLTLSLLLSGCDDRLCCRNEAGPADAAPHREVHAVFDEGIHTLDIPYSNAPVAPGPHREVYEKNCSVCHTTRYISMQPLLTEKKWGEELTKMIKTFGAPITEADGKLILEYLIAVKGRK